MTTRATNTSPSRFRPQSSIRGVKKSFDGASQTGEKQKGRLLSPLYVSGTKYALGLREAAVSLRLGSEACRVRDRLLQRHGLSLRPG